MVALTDVQLRELVLAAQQPGLVRVILEESFVEPLTLVVTEWHQDGETRKYEINDNGKKRRMRGGWAS